MLITVPSAQGAKPKTGPEKAAVRLILPDESEPSIRRGDKRHSTTTGAPLTLYRVGHKVAAGSPREMASQYLR